MTIKHDIISSAYSKYRQKLYIHAFNLLEDSENAKDIVNEVFCSLLESKRDFYDEDNLLPLLYTMVKNRCIDYIRHQNVTKKNEKTYIQDIFGNWTKEDYIKYEQRIEDVQNQLNRMAPQMRTVIEEFFFNQKKCHEISQQLNISDNTVRTHIYRALKMLRNHIHCLF